MTHPNTKEILSHTYRKDSGSLTNYFRLLIGILDRHYPDINLLETRIMEKITVLDATLDDLPNPGSLIKELKSRLYHLALNNSPLEVWDDSEPVRTRYY